MCKALKRSNDIKRHINCANSNVPATAEDNTDESVACAGSFNGDTAEICTGKEDALSRTTAVQTGKSEEDERSQLEEKEMSNDSESSLPSDASVQSNMFDCPYELIDDNFKDDDPDVALVDNFIGNHLGDQLEDNQIPKTVLVDGSKSDGSVA